MFERNSESSPRPIPGKFASQRGGAPRTVDPRYFALIGPYGPISGNRTLLALYIAASPNAFFWTTRNELPL